MEMLVRNCWFTGHDGSVDILKTNLPKMSGRAGIKVFASQKSIKKSRKGKPDMMALETSKDFVDELGEPKKKNVVGEEDGKENGVSRVDNVAERGNVLQACTVTSSLIAALGITIRQVSHVASVEGLQIFDCSAEPSFGFESWHLEVILGLVVFISSSRYLLLKSWPEFAESSEAANKQVLTALEPLDYILVAFLPGISEELLFRGALLPLFGLNVYNALAVGAVFGILHLGSGRKSSFAIWATFVGFVYGYATLATSSIIVPMASHGFNNLIGALLWRYSSSHTSKKL